MMKKSFLLFIYFLHILEILGKLIKYLNNWEKSCS